MRLIEFIFIITVCFVIIQPKRKVVTAYWVFFILHFFVDGMRWQLVPVYVIALLYTIFLFTGLELKKKRFRIPFSLLLTFGVFAGFVMPVFNLPKPTGEYSIGTRLLYFTDETREENNTENANDKREIQTKIWYPCDNVTGLPEKYLKDSNILGAMSEAMWLPSFIFDHLALVDSHSYPMAKISNNKDFPIIIFSPGYMSFSGQNRVLLEELASRGYVVISFDHYYDAAMVKAQNGDYIGLNKSLMESMFSMFLDNKHIYDSGREKNEIKDFLKLSTISNKSIVERALDITFLVENITTINNRYLDNKMDTSNIGIIGHSYGGATAIEASLYSKQIKAGINLDGYPYGSLCNDLEVEQPFMIFNADDGFHWTRDIEEQFKNDLYTLNLKGGVHMDFTDSPIMSPIFSYFEMTGKNSGKKTVEIVNNHVIDFFDHYLKGQDIKLISGNGNEYPEVEYN